MTDRIASKMPPWLPVAALATVLVFACLLAARPGSRSSLAARSASDTREAHAHELRPGAAGHQPPGLLAVRSDSRGKHVDPKVMPAGLLSALGWDLQVTQPAPPPNAPDDGVSTPALPAPPGRLPPPLDLDVLLNESTDEPPHGGGDRVRRAATSPAWLDETPTEDSIAPVEMTPSGAPVESAVPEMPAEPQWLVPESPGPLEAEPDVPAGPVIDTVAGPPARLDTPHPHAHRRSRELELVARQADTHIRRGFELAGRRAYFAARAEFVSALRVMAQALDAEHQTTIHSKALAAGLIALKEAEDFVPDTSQLAGQPELEEIAGPHQTPVLKGTGADWLTAMDAQRAYLTFAQEQLATAAGREVSGAMALYALGKLHAAVSREYTARIEAAEPKAIVFFQAALLADPGNYMALNDMGVLLARGGRYEDARKALERRLAIYCDATGWRNLATVYERLGLMDRAGRARALAQRTRGPAASTPHASSRNLPIDVRWVDPSEFAETGPGSSLAIRQPSVPPARPPAARQSAPPEPGSQKRIAGSLPWDASPKTN